MAKVVKVIGVRKVTRALRKAGVRTGKQVERGLKKAGLFIQRISQEVVPIDTSALKNSAFTRATGSGFNVDVQVGYTKGYAIYVHERTELRHAPGKQAKFLEEPVRTKRQEILRIIKQEAAVKPGGV